MTRPPRHRRIIYALTLHGGHTPGTFGGVRAPWGDRDGVSWLIRELAAAERAGIHWIMLDRPQGRARFTYRGADEASAAVNANTWWGMPGHHRRAMLAQLRPWLLLRPHMRIGIFSGWHFELDAPGSILGPRLPRDRDDDLAGLHGLDPATMEGWSYWQWQRDMWLHCGISWFAFDAVSVSSRRYAEGATPREGFLRLVSREPGLWLLGEAIPEGEAQQRASWWAHWRYANDRVHVPHDAPVEADLWIGTSPDTRNVAAELPIARECQRRGFGVLSHRREVAAALVREREREE